MSYPSNAPDPSGYYASGPPGGHEAGGYGAYPQWSPEPRGGARLSPQHLTLAVAVLGLAAYLCSYGPVLPIPGIDWDVRFPVLAGLVAALGLLARQPRTALVIAVLAAIGFLDALSNLITVPEGVQPGWALWAIVVLNFLQTAVAVVALRAQPAAPDEQKVQELYSAYAEQYARAAEYYSQYNEQAQPEPTERSATAQAQQEHRVSAPAQAFEAFQASPYGSYADYVTDRPPAQAPQPVAPAPRSAAPRPAGLPSFGQTQAFVPPHQRPAAEPEQRPQGGN
jgi:Family of unknown function (DUF5336)